MRLSNQEFARVIDRTPLVSFDLVIQNPQGQILLGERKNRPAQDYWFVPGGRILKNESLAEAFQRLTLNELGEAFAITDAALIGPYDHFYTDSVFGEQPATHYVAIAYQLSVGELANLPDEQHTRYRWFSVEELLANDRVHKHTKAYFL